MRNKRETDISSYMGKTPEQQPEITYKRSESGAKRFFKGLGKFLLTIFSVLAVAGIVTAISLAIYIIALASEPTGIDLKAKSMNQTSRIFIKDSDTGEFTETRKLYSTENRIWVDNQNIPDYMKEAQVAIEDKRFYEHNGVDWQRTLSAVAMLATGSDSYGGSTITQQLIKNITDDNEVSINRKLREICKALKLEQEYTKDQILEAYLNVVNYGNNCQGVEAAAQLYFGKSIKDCSLAECAAIAGITQNPSRWNPLIYPENNRERRELILSEMYDQGVIKTKKEYDEAMSESAKMTFVGFKSASEDEDDEDNDVQNWYYDQLFYDLRDDLARYYNISPDAASEKIYTEGLKIYCAMDEKMQNYIEKEAMNIDKSADPSIELGSVLMDFDGRVIATVGSSNRKTQTARPPTSRGTERLTRRCSPVLRSSPSSSTPSRSKTSSSTSPRPFSTNLSRSTNTTRPRAATSQVLRTPTARISATFSCPTLSSVPRTPSRFRSWSLSAARRSHTSRL